MDRPAVAASSVWVERSVRHLRARGDIAALVVVLLATVFLLPRGLPFGVAALGIVGGVAVAINALGVIVVYRSTRIINFAQIAFGSITAVWFYLWLEHLQWIVVLHRVCHSCVPWVPAGANLQANPNVLLDAIVRESVGRHNAWATILLQFNFWFSLAAALGLAVLASWGSGKLVTRFWAGAPRLVPMVAMLGQGLAIAVGSISVMRLRDTSIKIPGLPRVAPLRWWPYHETAETTLRKGLESGATRSGDIYVPLGHPTIKIGAVPFHVAEIATVLLGVLVFVAVFAYFRYTRAGVVIRGLSENADRAKTLGIDSDRLVHRTWALSGLLSGVVGALAVLANGPLALLSGFDLKLLAIVLAVTVFARFTSLSIALFAGVALGVVSQAMFSSYNSLSGYHVLLVVLLGLALLLQTKRATRAEQEAAVAWLASPEIRPTPRELRHLTGVRSSVRWGIALAVLVIVGLPFVADPGQIIIGSQILINVLLGLSLLVLTGWAGQVSLGQVALAAVGAYVAVDLAIVRGIPLPIALFAGAIAGAVAAGAVGVPALRLRGPYLVVMTLLFSIGITDTLLSPYVLGGRIPSGFRRPLMLGMDLNDERVMYFLCLILLVACVVAVLGLKRSRTRRALIAARDNEPAAQVFGIGLVTTRLEGFAVSGFLAGLAGALLAIQTHGVRPATFSAQLSILVFLMIVIGGAGTLAGPLVGGAYLGAFTLLGSTWASFASGGGAVGLLQFAPGGLAGLAFKMRDAVLRRIAIRHRISVPSLLAGFTHTASGVIRARILPKQAGRAGDELVVVRHRLTGPGPGPVEGTLLGPRAAENGSSLTTATSADEPTSLLSCRRLDVRYDQMQVLFGVDFDVRAGEIVGLVGTNGAGKTTLLRAISGLHHASGGAVYLDGDDITRARADVVGAAGVVTVPGGGGVFPSLTVAENLRVAGWARPVDSDEREAEILDAFPRLRERLSIPAGDLSGGEQQMLALAMAFVVRPRLLMVDELSLGLSPQIVQTILDLLQTMRDDGTAIVVVEQSLNLTLTIAQRAVVLEKGEVRYAGSAQQLLNHPELFAAISFGAAGSGLVGGSEIVRRRRELDERREVALQATGIRTSYGGVVAVEDVSLEVCAGDVVGIIGPNGAGKTTLFDVLSGFQPAENGSVLLFGADVTGMSASARGALGLQRSFQSVRLFPSLTVRDNIAVALETHLNTRSAALSALWLPNARRAEAKAQQRVDQLIELMELDEHQDKVMSEMSTGMRRIVDIACQLAARPKVLLLDEPSSGLAQTETEALGPIISRISKDLDCAVLVIEHDIPLVTAVSSTLVAMDLGRVIATGTPDEVVSDPVVRNAYFGGASDRVVQRSGQRRKAPAWEVVNV